MEQRNERVFTLQGALSIVFSNPVYVVVAITSMNYNTVVAWKFRWKRRKLSYEKQEDVVLKFGFRKVAEFRYTFPDKEIKQSIDKVMEDIKLNTN